MKDFLSRSLQTVIVFLVIAGILALALGGYFRSVSDWFGGSLVEVQSWISIRFVAVQEFLTVPRDVAALRQRNAELEAQVSSLQTRIVQLEQQVADTEALAALVRFAQTSPESSYMAASVIGRDPSPFLHYIIIDRGSNDGIRRGMPVVTEQGLVGRIDAVVGNAARVQLITDAASSINIRLEKAQTDAVLIGSLAGDLSLDLVSQDVTINTGDVVLTSGLGGGFPKDLIVGQVLAVRQQDSDLFQRVDVQPIVDFAQIKIVLVITDFNPVNIQPLIPIP